MREPRWNILLIVGSAVGLLALAGLSVEEHCQLEQAGAAAAGGGWWCQVVILHFS